MADRRDGLAVLGELLDQGDRGGIGADAVGVDRASGYHEEVVISGLAPAMVRSGDTVWPGSLSKTSVCTGAFSVAAMATSIPAFLRAATGLMISSCSTQ